jgi:hypothetical protein
MTTNLVPGSSVALRCLGAIAGPCFLDGRTGNGTVGLAAATDGHFTGTHWTVINDGAGHAILKCVGDVDGPRFLDGRTKDGSVGLAPGTDGVFTGTHWEVDDNGPGRVVLKCLGNIEGPRFLDGRTGNGTVGLAPATDRQFTGTHWEVLSLAATDSKTFVSGNLVVPGSLPLNGNATVEMHVDGDWVFTPHAHDSGFDPIAYALSAVVVTPSGKPFAFERGGQVGGTSGGGPRDDDPGPFRGNNSAISDNWAGIVAATYKATIDGTDQFPLGLRQTLEALVQQALQAALQAVEQAVKDELVQLISSLAD